MSLLINESNENIQKEFKDVISVIKEERRSPDHGFSQYSFTESNFLNDFQIKEEEDDEFVSIHVKDEPIDIDEFESRRPIKKLKVSCLSKDDVPKSALPTETTRNFEEIRKSRYPLVKIKRLNIEEDEALSNDNILEQLENDLSEYVVTEVVLSSNESPLDLSLTKPVKVVPLNTLQKESSGEGERKEQRGSEDAPIILESAEERGERGMEKEDLVSAEESVVDLLHSGLSKLWKIKALNKYLSDDDGHHMSKVTLRDILDSSLTPTKKNEQEQQKARPRPKSKIPPKKKTTPDRDTYLSLFRSLQANQEPGAALNDLSAEENLFRSKLQQHGVPFQTHSGDRSMSNLTLREILDSSYSSLALAKKKKDKEEEEGEEEEEEEVAEARPPSRKIPEEGDEGLGLRLLGGSKSVIDRDSNELLGKDLRESEAPIESLVDLSARKIMFKTDCHLRPTNKVPLKKATSPSKDILMPLFQGLETVSNEGSNDMSLKDLLMSEAPKETVPDSRKCLVKSKLREHCLPSKDLDDGSRLSANVVQTLLKLKALKEMGEQVSPDPSPSLAPFRPQAVTEETSQPSSDLNDKEPTMPVLTAIRPITPGPPTKPISPLTATSPVMKYISPLNLRAEPPPVEPSVPPSACSIINEYLKEHQISDDDLIGLSVRELNARLTKLPEGLRREYKSRRRTLKNRGYAQNCRLKRASTSKEMRLMNKLLNSKLQITSSKFVILMQNFDFLLKDFHDLMTEKERLMAGGESPANLVSESDFVSEMHLRLEKQWSAEVEKHDAVTLQIKDEIETCRKEKNEFQCRLMQQEQDRGCYEEDLNQEFLAEEIASSTQRLNRLLNASDSPPGDSTASEAKETHDRPQQQKTFSGPLPLDLAFRSHPLPD